MIIKITQLRMTTSQTLYEDHKGSYKLGKKQNKQKLNNS